MTSRQMAAMQAGMPPRKLSADEERLAPNVLRGAGGGNRLLLHIRNTCDPPPDRPSTEGPLRVILTLHSKPYTPNLKPLTFYPQHHTRNPSTLTPSTINPTR